jgi:hypothetical protein
MLIYGNNIFHQQVNRHGAMVGALFHIVDSQDHRIESGCGYTKFSVALQKRHPRLHVVGIFNRHGAAEARGAHNSEDTRSKRVAGNH